ncbi:unnamed protein product, partial [Didymodactylos carnosus]
KEEETDLLPKLQQELETKQEKARRLVKDFREGITIVSTRPHPEAPMEDIMKLKEADRQAQIKDLEKDLKRFGITDDESAGLHPRLLFPYSHTKFDFRLYLCLFM